MSKINNVEYDIYNCSTGKANYSQRNNKFTWNCVRNSALISPGDSEKDRLIKASTMCNVTCMCMGLDYSGFKFPKGKFEQPEDNLCDFIINSAEVDAEYKRTVPAMYEAYKRGDKDSYTPNEIHALLSMGTNLWMGTKATQFTTDGNIRDIINSEILTANRPVIISGVYRNLNHIVDLVGVAVKAGCDPKTTAPDYLIIDDPYGNLVQGYDKNLSGNDIIIPWQYFIDQTKPLKNATTKWFHTFNKPLAII